ncbi:MAG: hypothetical protein EBW37_06565 [Rhodobacteraceae bacterium]|nr:hypothetical protein [Paracoccaceae bacterium]
MSLTSYRAAPSRVLWSVLLVTAGFGKDPGVSLVLWPPNRINNISPSQGFMYDFDWIVIV